MCHRSGRRCSRSSVPRDLDLLNEWNDAKDPTAFLLTVRTAQRCAVIRGRMDEMGTKRRASQPREASAGCVFKNPEGDKAGRLIDLSGLKGRAVGPVSVSPTHANFLVNSGAAQAADFIALMRTVRAEVKSRQGVELHPEIIALGREWKELL